MTALVYTAAPYDPEAHGAFVVSSFRAGSGRERESLVERLRRGGRCLVAHVPGRPDLLLGWAAKDHEGRVIWCYTRQRLRRRGLMTALLLELEVDVSEPTPCLFWSPAAAEMAARGYRIFPLFPERSRDVTADSSRLPVSPPGE